MHKSRSTIFSLASTEQERYAALAILTLTLHQEEDTSSFYVRVPARVLGCLRGGEITIILFPGHGLVLTEPIQTYVIPEDLRMPNSEFHMLFKHPGREMSRIL